MTELDKQIEQKVKVDKNETETKQSNHTEAADDLLKSLQQAAAAPLKPTEPSAKTSEQSP